MVHVMSEVKCSTCKGVGRLEFEQGQRRVPCVTCSGSGIDWRKTCDAQRLRADTAEAEREALRSERNKADLRASRLKVDNENYDRLLTRKSNQCHAAEQRIAELTALLQRVVDSSALSFEADAPEDLESLEVDICAALNPNPEAESHDQ